MKAVVYTRYGPPEVLQWTDVPTPVARPGEVLVKVRAVSLNRSDWEALIGKPFYARFGGLFNLIGISRDYDSDRVISRFAVVRRERMVAW